MALLARRNLFHDRFRFAVTLTGIVFALVLIIVQFGFFLGFTTTSSNNIDHSDAHLWIVFHGVGYFDTGRMFSERKCYEVLATPGVQQAEKYIQSFAFWKKPDGGPENIQVIGFGPGSGLGEPWNVVQGDTYTRMNRASAWTPKSWKGRWNSMRAKRYPWGLTSTRI